MFSIRAAAIEETPILLSIRNRAAAAGCASCYSEAQLSAWLGAPLPQKVEVLLAAQAVFVAESEGQIIGYGALDASTQEVEAVFVDPSATGRGVGRSLLDAVEACAVGRGISELQLSSTLNAAAFYAAAGYFAVRTQETRVSSGTVLQSVLMEKHLNVTG